MTSNRSLGGLRARNAGKATETWFETSCRQYDGVVVRRNYMHTEIIANSPKGFAKIMGKAYPDWDVVIGPLDGKSCLIDAKSVSSKNKKTMEFEGTLSKQYHAMLDNIKVGGLGFFLVEWKHDSYGSDFRLFSAAALRPNRLEMGKRPSMTFVRDQGLPIDLNRGLPDWLPVVIDYAKGM